MHIEIKRPSLEDYFLKVLGERIEPQQKEISKGERIADE